MVWLAPWCVNVGRATRASPCECADVAELVRVGHQAYSANLSVLEVERHDHDRLACFAQDDAWTRVDRHEVEAGVRSSHEAARRDQERGYVLAAVNRPSSRAADLAAAVRPQPHVVGEQVREPAHVAVVGSLHEARDDAPMFGRRWLKAPLPARQLFLRTAEDLATRGFVPFDNFGDLPVLVVEDLAQ